MGSKYEIIISSSIFKFVVGPHNKEYIIHGAAISSLSKPLDVLLNGNMREAQEKCVKWPDIDEKTFVRSAQWAYTRNYDTEEPEIILDYSSIGVSPLDQEGSGPKKTHTDREEVLRKPLYSLASYAPPESPKNIFNLSRWTQSQRVNLIKTFLDERGTKYPTSTPAFLPRKNTEGCEDYTGVFLCHAKLYVLGDKYDVPPLRRLALHRLHATLKEFTLYPSRMNDIATLASYVFDNTAPKDRIRNMITLYYACIVEDASKYDGLKSLIDEIPDFAFGLISKMAERLA